MKHRRSFQRAAAVFGGLLLSVFAASLTALAATGTLKVTMEYEGEALTTGSLKAYKAAEAPESAGYNFTELTEAFAGSGVEVSDEILSDETKMEELANSLISYAEEQNIEPQVRGNVENGAATLNLPEEGIYLVAQDELTRGYAKITPFLIKLPSADKDGALVWDLEAKAKIEPNVCRANPPIKKEVRRGSVTGELVTNVNDPFTFVMMPGAADYPMPRGSQQEADGSIRMVQYGGGEYEFGWMYYDEADIGKTYTYELYEEQGTNNYRYSENRYTVTVSVKADDKGDVTADVSCSRDDGAALDTSTWDPIDENTDRALFINVIPAEGGSSGGGGSGGGNGGPGGSSGGSGGPGPGVQGEVQGVDRDVPGAEDPNGEVLGALREGQDDPGVLGAGRLPKMGEQQKSTILWVFGVILVILVVISRMLGKKK